MYSIASWSLSQSEPLIVSYMCHSQLSSDMLPSDAPIPPCAATVCDRVGKTFDSTATDKPASASCNDARIPAPPAPTMTASKCITGKLLAITRAGDSYGPPQDLDRPPCVRDQHADDDHLHREAPSGRLHIIHRDVADAHPGMEKQRHHEKERGELERIAREEPLPHVVIKAAVPEDDAEHEQRVERHHDGRHPLRQPVAPSVMRADRFVRRIGHHSRTATMTVNSSERTSTIAEERRAGARSTPTCTSIARWRNPASR